MRTRITLRAGQALLPLFLLTSPLQAERNDPGSLLIFPEFDSRPGAITFLTVTNTNTDPVAGAVRVHFNYVDGESCQKADASELLSPGDTITLFARAHAPNHGHGFAYAYARGISTAGPITFNHLIGSALIYQGLTATEYSVNALVYEGKTGEGNGTDLDSDGIRDLDGLEYGLAPDRIAIPRFFGQLTPAQGDDVLHEELVLVGLTGTKFDTTISFLIYNDNEEVFSAQHTFSCWEKVPLLQISGVFGNTFLANYTNDDPDEILGLPGWEAGWFVMDGQSASSTTTTIPDPAFLAVLLEASRFSSASLPFTLGEQENGALLPTSLSGDD